MDLVADLKEVDASIKMVKRSLASNDIDTATHFLGKSAILIGVLKDRIAIPDIEKFEELKDKV